LADTWDWNGKGSLSLGAMTIKIEELCIKSGYKLKVKIIKYQLKVPNTEYEPEI
jgi:hypothetical protein